VDFSEWFCCFFKFEFFFLASFLFLFFDDLLALFFLFGEFGWLLLGVDAGVD